MSELKIPGQSTADAQQKAQKEQIETKANLFYDNAADSTDFGPDYTYNKIRFHKKDEVNVYAAAQDARYAIDPRLKKLIIVAVATFVVFFLAAILPTQLFNRAQFSASIWLSELAQDFQSFIGFFMNPDTMYGSYLLTIVVTLFAGAAMGLSGGIFQGSLRNALASPSTLGVTSGGTVGSILFALLVYPNVITAEYNGSYSDLVELYNQMGPLEHFLEEFGGFICSLLGCFSVVFLIMAIALIAGRGKVSNVALVVAGQVFTATSSIIISAVQTWLTNHGEVDMSTYLAKAQTSTFTGAYTLTSVLWFIVPLVLCMAFCFANSRKLSLLAFNEEEARSMGISTTRMRNGMVAVCTVMTALVVSYCGPVGFVGFLIPHIARKIVGPDLRYLLPACALMGALMVTFVFYLTEVGFWFLPTGSTGVITSIIGCIAFVWVAVRGRRSSNGDWL